MSYILDALRKSELQRQRERGAAPLLLSTQISSHVDAEPALLIYGLFAIILVIAGILIGWLRPWQLDKTVNVKDSITIQPHKSKPLQIEPIQKLSPPKPEKAKKSELIIPAQKSISIVKIESEPEILEKSEPAPSKVTAQLQSLRVNSFQSKLPRQLVGEAAKPKIEKSTPSSIELNGANGPAETAQEQKIIAMTELPIAIQQEIPMMSISGFAYSSIPKERSVGINDHLLQEGDYLAPGLRLEQITTDGLVFSYKRYLFRHSM